jgi:hypothetical protein
MPIMRPIPREAGERAGPVAKKREGEVVVSPERT